MNKRSIQLCLILSVSLNIILVFNIWMLPKTKKANNIIVLKEFNKLSEKDKRKLNENLITNDNNYLFLGDSITYQYDLDKYYPNLPVINSGINGDKTIDIMNNMKKRVYDYNPSKIFLLIGTNQLANQTDEEIFEDITNLTEEIHENRKYAHIYVESIYPINENINNYHTSMRSNERIRKINKMLKDYYKDSYVDYIDIYSELADDEGNLKREYSNDALHLTDEGYKVVTSIIKKYI